MKLLLSCYYCFSNVGDDAVLQAIVAGLKAVDSAADISVLSSAPSLTAEINQVKAIPRYRSFSVLAALARTDVLISGGGTLFQNVTSNFSLLYYLGLILIAKLFRKKTMVFGQGFGPVKGRFWRRLVAIVLNRVDLITLRD